MHSPETSLFSCQSWTALTGNDHSAANVGLEVLADNSAIGCGVKERLKGSIAGLVHKVVPGAGSSPSLSAWCDRSPSVLCNDFPHGQLGHHRCTLPSVGSLSV
jgi:hypothetical protein